MKAWTLIFAIIFIALEMQTANAVFYECTYKNKAGVFVVSSFNPTQKYRQDYDELSSALKTGNCKELYIKKYIIEATSCNIQFYKYNGKIANLSCRDNNPIAMQRLKEIAEKEFGYYK